MSNEWMIIFGMFIFICAYFSYKFGYDNGQADGVGSLLDSLINSDVIEMDEETGIVKAKK
jgi:hypothetical protein